MKVTTYEVRCKICGKSCATTKLSSNINDDPTNPANRGKLLTERLDWANCTGACSVAWQRKIEIDARVRKEFQSRRIREVVAA